MEKINIIIPIVSNNYDLSKKTKQLKAFLKKYEDEFNVFFVACKCFEKPKNYRNSQNYKLIETPFQASNHLIAKGFEQLSEGAVIILDFENENWQQILSKIFDKKSVDNIVLYKNTYKKSKIKKYLFNLLIKAYHSYLKFLGLQKDLICSNTFQYFNQDAVKVIKSLNDKNAYLRNFDTLTGYNIEMIELLEEQNKQDLKLLDFKNSNIKRGVSSLVVSLLFLILSLVFTNAILALNNGIGYYFLILALSIGAILLSGYLLVKDIIKSRGDL